MLQEQCADQFSTWYDRNATEPYCNATWDGILCWPPTLAGTIVRLSCPPEKGLDVTKFATRECGRNGVWLGRNAEEDDWDPVGWSNYTDCFTEEIRILMEKLYSTTEADMQLKLRIAKGTRIIEMLGLSTSLVALLVSLTIFTHFSSLRNKRTQLHRNLFVAMFVQVLVRLVLYSDQWLTRQDLDDPITSRGQYSSIEQTPMLCESFYVLLEYARTAVFVWMFLEGLHLHSSIVVVFPRKFNYTAFHAIGWGVPLLLVTIWTSVMSKWYYHTLCWWGYTFSSYYWILEAPRMFVIVVNLMILLNIVFVIVMKLQETNSNEFQQLRKAVRAALLLLPLLGIPSILDAVPVPVESSPLHFAVWSYSTHTMSSLQGFFIALLYCFLNREVRNVVSKHWLAFRLSHRPIQKHCCVAVDSGGRRSLNRNNSTIEDQKAAHSAAPECEPNDHLLVQVLINETASKPSSKTKRNLSLSPSESPARKHFPANSAKSCEDVLLIHQNGFRTT